MNQVYTEQYIFSTLFNAFGDFADFLGAQLEHHTVPLAPSLHGWAFDGKKYLKGAIDNVEMALKKKGLPPPMDSSNGKIDPFTS